MAKKKKEDNNEIPEFDTTEVEKSLKRMVDDILKLATDVVDEYKGLDVSELSDLSGSALQISEDSPFLNEIFEGDSWKRVITNMENKSKKTNEDASE